MSTSRPLYLKAFFCALGIALLLFLPFVVFDRGYFVYYGDFNVQQIPFYMLAHEAVRGGDIFWSFYTDLGANFIGSYSFYLLFSPFFWLTLPFPTHWLPFMMAPLLVLKTACAALTSCMYLERFVKDRGYAIIGSLLYAFSGWMLFNVFFNHFHDVAVFFPLLLLGVEKLVCENKKGLFALAVFINAIVNYWFFVGEVVFTILYVLIRMTDKEWRMNLGKFLRLSTEAVLGVGMAAAALLPSVLAIAGNTRIGTSELLTGWNLWIYWQTQNQLAILQNPFFPPELPARLSFFPDAGAAWSSRTAWLPLVGMTGVLAYFFQRKNDWVKKLLALSLLLALVPGLNSLFVLLNHSYYARWYYMPILLMALASARALEDSFGDTAHINRAIKWCMIISAAFIAMSGLTPQRKDGVITFGLQAYPRMFWAISATAVFCLIVMKVLIVFLRGRRNFKLMLGTGVALVSVIFGIFYLANGKNTAERSRFIINSAIGGRELIGLPGEPFARMDVYESIDNLGMFWHRPTIQAFHSIVPPSIMEFYPEVGVKRDVGSRPSADIYALRPLLSARWLVIERTHPEQEPMPGYIFHSEQIGFNIYENENFIPMGFGYAEYIERGQLEEIDENRRAALMLRAIVLEDSQAARRYGDILACMDTAGPLDFSYNAVAENAQRRREQSCYHFARDNRGFTAYSNLEEDALIFFSIPYDSGWTATVNGAPAYIEKVNVGFMAARVPAGYAEIRFDYFTPGLITGGQVSGAMFLLFVCYLLICRKFGRKEDKHSLDIQRALFMGEAVSLSWEDYLTRYYNERQARKLMLQSALDDKGGALNPNPAEAQ